MNQAMLNFTKSLVLVKLKKIKFRKHSGNTAEQYNFNAAKTAYLKQYQ